MNGTYSFGKRLLAIMLCIAMVLSYLPAMALTASAAEGGNKVVDPSTINRWKDLFGPNALSTEYAGGVWTDKSVFDDFDAYLQAIGVSQLQGPTAAITSQVRDMLDTDPENFLVALSAIAANQEISGYTTTPTDTMLVLDVSQSMDNQGYVPGMITAANATIKTLMDGNQHNRVGIVLFSGSNTQNSNQGTSSATVLLPLDHYTATNNEKTFLRYTGSASDTSVYIATGVKNSAGTTMNSYTGKTTNGGTYTQNGLYKAWGEFSKLTAADTVIPEGQPQAGTKRLPAVVLMSDGQPTVGDTTYYDIGNSTIGDGTTPSQTNGDRMSFLTQLTAAWVKAKVANKYGIENEEVRFYTLGLNTQNNRYATDTLNPAASTNEDVADYWTEFVAETPNDRGQVTLGGNGYFGGWTTYKSTDDMITSAAQRVYPTQYFSANDTEKLGEAFATIADELTTGTPYVTLVSDGEANLDGYITFEDQLGAMMEVKDIKGLVMGDRVFTGAELAKSMNEGDLGQSSDPKDYGNEFVRTVKERLGITDTAIAQNLIRNAYHSGQLSYTNATEYANYIGWYADAEGNYVGFWQESDGYGSEGAPENAAYINKSYGYLGAESSEAGASDMMHVVVMVHTEIATGDQSIIYKIPASLIPTVMYSVELEGTDASNPKSITREDAFPLQLLAEVGLRSDINAVNLEQKVAEYIENGGHAHKNNDGTYDFYTNRWGYGHGDEVDYDEPLTHVVAQSHFHPATDNSRYYVTEETLLCVDQNGTPYTGEATPTGTGYYHARSYYEVVRGNTVVTTKYLPVSAITLAQVQREGRNWYIPAGVPFQETERFRVEKAPNATGTLTYADYPTVLHDAAGYNIYAFLGNNGKLTMAPAQGIALTKTVAELSEDTNAPTEFTFRVTLSQAVADPVVTDTDGDPIAAEKWSVSRNVITVKLSTGETVVITGIPTGTTYTVEEEVTSYYVASSVNASGTVAANTVNSVDFVNTAKGYGSLVVGKDVNYPQGFVPGTAHNSKEFTIVVEFTGDITGIVAPAGAVRSGNAFTLKLKDGESVTFTNIPEGTVYTVSEGAAPAGYAFQELRYTDETRTIAADDLDEAEVVNSYTLQPVSPNVKVQGSKTLVTNESSWGDETFTVELFRIDDFADQDPVSTGLTATVSKDKKDYEIDLSSISFTTAGTYYFRAVEVIPEDRDLNIAYDRTYGLFSITVGDADADGNLEIQSVDAYQSTGVSGNAANGWIIEKNFTNVVTTDRIYLDIQKNVVDAADNTPVNAHRGDITFGLFANMNAGTAPTYYMLTDTAGKATIMVPVTQQIISEASGSIVYYLREIAPAAENRVVGMHYDESWLYAIEITWDAQNNTAVVRYAPIVNGTVGTYETYVEGTTVFNHTNTYEKDVKVALELSGEKTLNGGTDLGGREFSFSLYNATAAFVQRELIETVENNGSTIAFADVTFTEPGVYYMVARENASDLGGVTIDGAVYHITVEVEKFVDTDDTTRLRLAGNPSVVKYGTSTNVGADGLDFNNSYTITGSEDVTISGHKTLTGRELIAGEFEFGLYEGEKLVSSVKNLTNGNFSFPTITYTPADIGTHTYSVKEIVPTEKLGGVTYDDAVFTVVVKVEDDGEGGMTVTKTVNGDANGAIEFENTYDTQPIDVTLTGSKTLYNQDADSYIALTGGEFTFELHTSDANFAIKDQLAVPAVTNGADGAISILLEDLEAGDYYYTLREDLGSANGMHYDTSVFNIRVLVTDNGDGTLRSMVTIRKSGNGTNVIAFGNTYTPEPVEYAISGTKVLTGRDNVLVADGEFSFELYDAENNLLETVSNETDGSFTFTAIEYEKSGTYTYTVKEHVPTGHVNNVYKGVTYDTNSYTVTVVVTDNQQTGTLEAVATYPAGGLTITNTYEGKATTVNIQGEKILTGRQWKENESYTFYLYDVNNNHVGTAHSKPQVVGGETKHLFTFENIPLSEAKTYVFAVREMIPAGEHYGVNYSNLNYKVQVTVTDNGTGNLVAGTPVITLNDQPQSEMVFTNTYSAAPTTATIRAIKALEGKTLTGGMFEFELYDENNQLVERVSNKADGAVNFSAIPYTEAGTYTYTIKEVIPAGAVNNVYQGITYDPTEHTVTVEVVDNGDGTLTATPVYDGGSVRFTNTYAITESVKVDIAGTKTLNGKDLADGMFTFRLYDENGTQVGSDVTNTGNSFLFTDVELTEAKTYSFTVKEVIPSAAINTVYKGVDYDERVYTAYVTARDNGVGGLTASAVTFNVSGVDLASMEFVNRYSVSSTQLTLDGTKNLTGREIIDGEFFFDVFEGADKVAEGTNDGNAIVFEPIKYTAAGDHTYTVKERIPADAVNNISKGVTYDTKAFTVTVQVIDNGDGTLTAVPTYADGAIAFENSYETASAFQDIEGMKVLEGKDIAENTFTFHLLDEAKQFLADTVTDSTGKFVFQNVELAAAKTYTFYVVEVIPAEAVETVLDGMDYDEREYKVTIEVTDNGDGTMTAAAPVYWLNDAPADMVFNNVYSVTGTTHVDVSGEKKLTGKPMVAGDFTFELYKGEELIASVTNTAEGKFLFDAVTLTEIGEHIFTVVEKNTGVAGMDYDEREYTVKVVVGDNGVGGLKVESTEITLDGEQAALAFENVYTPAQITVDLPIEKTVQSLTEQTIGPEGFKFQLTDENGKQLGTVESDKLGKAKFSLVFQAEDIGRTFKATVSEVNTKKTGVVYSLNKYAVEITVAQADSGELIPTVTIDGKPAAAMQFVNVYQPAVTPVTGDNFSATLFISLMILSSFGLAAVIVSKKKEEAEESAQ